MRAAVRTRATGRKTVTLVGAEKLVSQIVVHMGEKEELVSVDLVEVGDVEFDAKGERTNHCA